MLDDPEEEVRWSLINIDSSYGYAGALAVESLGLNLRYLHLETHLFDEKYINF